MDQWGLKLKWGNEGLIKAIAISSNLLKVLTADFRCVWTYCVVCMGNLCIVKCSLRDITTINFPYMQHGMFKHNWNQQCPWKRQNFVKSMDFTLQPHVQWSAQAWRLAFHRESFISLLYSLLTKHTKTYTCDPSQEQHRNSIMHCSMDTYLAHLDAELRNEVLEEPKEHDSETDHTGEGKGQHQDDRTWINIT